MSDSDALHELMTVLLTAQDVEDVVSAAAPVIGTMFGPSACCRIVLADDELAGAAGGGVAGERVQIPIACDGEPLGTIIVRTRGAGARIEKPLDQQRAKIVSDLVGAAICAKRRAAGDQARLLKETAELKFDVVSMLSHEMRTPLTSIKGYASTLLLDDVDWDGETRVEFLQAIEAEADHLTELVSDLLESAAIDAGELRIALEPVAVPRIARRVVDLIGIQTTRHRFVLMFADDFPEIQADARRIEQVLTNLIDNAVKYSPDGGLVVVRGEVRDGEMVISVIDQGIGIAPEDLNKLFERFFRASPDRRRRIVGTGLGLPIAEAIVRAHGGRIWAESALESGTTLTFALPFKRPDSAVMGS